MTLTPLFPQNRDQTRGPKRVIEGILYTVLWSITIIYIKPQPLRWFWRWSRRWWCCVVTAAVLNCPFSLSHCPSLPGSSTRFKCRTMKFEDPFLVLLTLCYYCQNHPAQARISAVIPKATTALIGASATAVSDSATALAICVWTTRAATNAGGCCRTRGPSSSVPLLLVACFALMILLLTA